MQGKLWKLDCDGGSSSTNLTAPATFEQLREIVGGYIEVVPRLNMFFGEKCVAFCHEEGKLEGLPTNFPATRLWAEQLGVPLAKMEDVLVGPIAIVTGDDELLEGL